MEQKKNGMAVAAMVLGIVSLALFWTGSIAVICGILAIIFGVVALNKIKADADLAHTKGKAKGGLIMGIIGAVLGVVIIVLAMMAVSRFTDELQELDLENNAEYQQMLEDLENM